MRLLVVDDDPTILMVCRRVFGKLDGVTVTEAASGEEAIELLRSRAFDCVLTDQRMGAVPGIEVLEFALKERPKCIRIMMSGFADPRLIADAQSRARVHDFIEKPMTMVELDAILREVVYERYLKPYMLAERASA